MASRNPSPIPIERISAVLKINVESGRCFWRVGPRAGKEAGCREPRGYVKIMIGGVQYRRHRIVWTAAHGPIPPGMEIDHRSTDRTDDRIANLRLATHSQNAVNRDRPVGRTSSVLGVDLHRQTGRWRARIRAGGRVHHLGLFDDEASAGAAYKAAAERLHGEFARATA